MVCSRRSKRGFSLIEMAIVLVVIGIVLSGGLLAVSPVLESSKGNETNSKLDRVEQALTLYVIRYGCLPCPADPDIASGTANAGLSHGAGTTYYTGSCATTCNTQAAAASVSQGVVPWVTLGLSEEEGRDGYGYRIDYAVTTTLAATNGMVRTPPSTYPAGTLVVAVSAANDSAAIATRTKVTSAAAYVLISHGVDHSLAWNAAGKQLPDPNSGPDQTENSDGTPFVQDTPVRNAGTYTYFDDILRFRTAPMIIQLCGTNACGNPA